MCTQMGQQVEVKGHTTYQAKHVSIPLYIKMIIRALTGLPGKNHEQSNLKQLDHKPDLTTLYIF